ncbi:MAG: EamA family transporter [Nitrospinae bacterium]|nr:EamA family transporter [Nitrospinota bacterium]
MNTGAVYSLLSAALFGVSPVLAKLWIGDMSPLLLAGLLYLGSGAALHFVLLAKKQSLLAELKALSKNHRFKLLGSIVSGGILAPLCLAYGIKYGSAFEVSLLLNLETVATTLIAWLVFREHVGARAGVGMVLLVLGGIVISTAPQNGFSFSPAGLFLLGTCVFWGLDNSLTRDLDEITPSALGSVKGWAAGLFNTALAFVLGQSSAGLWQAAGMLGIGAVSYGVSLVLFVNALRLIGTSRTGMYFAVGPFFGMAFSVLLLGDRPALHQWGAALIMAVGLWTITRERHAHSHTHELFLHRHRHSFDEHHQHLHAGTEGPEPHDHMHTHEPMTHSHSHWPDIHHRHIH